MQRRLLPAVSLVITMSSLGAVAACAGRTIEPPFQNDPDASPTGTSTGSTQPTATGTATGTTTSTGTNPPPDTGPPPNPQGNITGNITGDPGCPSSLSAFNGECKTAGAVCDVNLTGSCSGTKLRYMCVRYDKYSPGYWTEALHPSLECSCPTTPPKYGSKCENSLPRECRYANPKCPGDEWAKSSWSCVDYGYGGGYWQGYDGYCYGGYDAGPYDPYDGGWGWDGGWNEPYPVTDAGTKPVPPTPISDGGSPKN